MFKELFELVNESSIFCVSIVFLWGLVVRLPHKFGKLSYVGFFSFV